jgi:hypothetical protein
MTLAVMSITLLVPALSGRYQPPFEDPVEALRAVHQRSDLAWLEMSDFFAPRAVVDYFGSSRTWDTPGQAEEWDFDVAKGGRATLESCRVDGDWGICRAQWADSLMEAAGLPDIAQEWRAKLDDDGLIAILRAEAITTPALAGDPRLVHRLQPVDLPSPSRRGTETVGSERDIQGVRRPGLHPHRMAVAALRLPGH